MDDLLTRGRNFGSKLLGLLDNISAGTVVSDPEAEQLAGVSRTGAALEQARRARLWAMMDPNVPWYAMTTAGGAAQQSAYTTGIAGAVKTAQELRDIQEKRNRTDTLRKWIENAPNVLDASGKPAFTPQQASVLPALDEATQNDALAQWAFPSLGTKGRGVATAGQIVATKRGENGNIIAVIQTGDPANPVTTIDTGVKTESELPSEIRTRLALMSNPALIDVNATDKRAGTEGTETGKAQVAFEISAPQTLMGLQQNRARSQELLQRISGYDTGKLTGPALALFNTEMQALASELADGALRQIAELKAQGVQLAPVSNEEFRMLLLPAPAITNNPQANAQILRRRIAGIDAIIADIEDQLNFVDAGGAITKWRPRQYRSRQPAAPSAAPASAPAPRTPNTASAFPTLPTGR